MAQRTVRAFMVPHVTPALDIESMFDRTPERCASVHGVGSSVFRRRGEHRPRHRRSTEQRDELAALHDEVIGSGPPGRLRTLAQFDIALQQTKGKFIAASLSSPARIHPLQKLNSVEL